MAERPPLEFMGPYNMPYSAFADYGNERWSESPDMEPLLDDEFFGVREGLVDVLRQHGVVYDDLRVGDSGYDFLIYDEMYFDRTQKILLGTNRDLPHILAAAMLQVQDFLQTEAPLWRAMVLANDATDREELFVVYPEVVRFGSEAPELNTSLALRRNAERRLRNLHRRERHQRERAAALRRAIRRAFPGFLTSEERFCVVGWFDTLSYLSHQRSTEGSCGTQIWILLRKFPAEDVIEDPERDIWEHHLWALPNGDVLETRPPSRDALPVVELEFVGRRMDEVLYRIEEVDCLLRKRSTNW